MKRAILATAAALLLASLSPMPAQAGGEASSARPVKEESEATRKPRRPKMKLRLSTYSSLNPLELKVSVEIALNDRRAIKACWIQEEWTNTTGVGLPFNKREETPCVPLPAEFPAPESFEKTFKLIKAGEYSYRVILEDREGKRYASATREVKVVESGLEFRFSHIIPG